MGSPFQHPLTALASRVSVRHTVRLRLTVLYSGFFLICGAGLLAVTYLLVRHFSAHVVSLARHGPVRYGRPAGGPAAALPKLPALAQLQSRADNDLVRQHSADLHQLLVWSLIALAAMTIVSVVLGWLVAGRVLRPLRTMIAATRRISQDNLHERLALEGPGDELKELADTIDGLLGRLEAAFDAQRLFVANASHELRTPLTRIRTALDVAVGKPAPVPTQVTALDRKIRDGLDRADRLLESFLALGRAQHGELADAGPVALGAIVATALADLDPEIKAKRIAVEQDLSATTLNGSATLLRRMVENVIDNAVRHNAANGWIRITLDDLDDRARLTIDSSGPTLHPIEVHELAQPFKRLGAERTGSENGVGLGLSIVAAIAAAHSGTLGLHARPEGGLSVVVELPHRSPTISRGQAG